MLCQGWILRDELLAKSECAWCNGEIIGTRADGLSPKELELINA